MKHCTLTLFASIALFSTPAFAQQAPRGPVCDCAAQQCLPYEREVTLVGRLDRSQGTDANNRTERFEIIVPERRVCGQRTATTPVAEGEFDLDEPGQTELQLHVPDAAVRAQITRLASTRARVEIRGRVWHSHTAHHHRELLFTVTAVTVAAAPSGAR